MEEQQQPVQQVEQAVQPEPKQEAPVEPAVQASEAPQPVKREETPRERPAREREQRDPNTIYVGRKPVMSYVLAAVTLFNNGSNEVKLKARGRATSRSIDVSQILKNRFFKDLKITGFDVGTEELTNEDGTQSRVSSLLLTLTK